MNADNSQTPVPVTKKTSRPNSAVASKSTQDSIARLRKGLGLMLISLFGGIAVAVLAMFAPAGQAIWQLAAMGMSAIGIVGMACCRKAPWASGRSLMTNAVVVSVVGVLFQLAMIGMMALAHQYASDGKYTAATDVVRMATLCQYASWIASIVGGILLVVFLRQLAQKLRREGLVKQGTILLCLFPAIIVLPFALMIVLPEAYKAFAIWVLIGMGLFAIGLQLIMMVGLRRALDPVSLATRRNGKESSDHVIAAYGSPSTGVAT